MRHGKIFIILFIASIILILFLLFNPRSQKIITGQILDCATKKPIPDVQISVNQSGWGFQNGQLVWDKDYISYSRSDSSGNFSISYKVGRYADIKTTKIGYLNAEQYGKAGNNVLIKMLSGDSKEEITYNCTRSSECLQCEKEGRVETCRNICIP